VVRLLQPGEHEELKATVHSVAGLLMLVCAAYNLGAWCVRRERHLAVNALVYSALTAWEAKNVAHHLRSM